jgi:cytidylate kinase
MYRAVALKARRLGITEPAAIARMAAGMSLSTGERILMDGEDVTEAIRRPGITEAVKPIADSPECRAELVRMQREARKGGGIVTEGRDQGSVVFPGADLKIYLDAALAVRAKRRQAQIGGELGEVERAIARRDQEDRTRRVGPLVRPAGAVEVDTSALTVEEVVDRILAAIKGP